MECEYCGVEIGPGWDYYEFPGGTLVCDECVISCITGRYRRCCGEERTDGKFSF